MSAAEKQEFSDRAYILTDADFSAISALVLEKSGIHLGDAKKDLVYSRLTKRIRTQKLSGFGEYLDFVKSGKGAAEREELISAITTNVTNFNREGHHFEHFSDHVAPSIIERARRGKPIRMWSAACSDGREPFTLAMSLLNKMPEAGNFDIKILATDIDRKSIQIANTGQYTADMVNRLDRATVDKWFEPAGDMMQVKQVVRNMVQFNVLNFLDDWPMKRKFDVIFCRNALIYFKADMQEKIFDGFTRFLNDDAYMYIGHSERIVGRAVDKFKSVGPTSFQYKPKGIE
ncbi:MAG: protein-glutamate O-methyltransferase [Rhizobiaceae bacterium]|nr:protein-glutamate O-methyltransferase [Rhizobiaceae bacterium]